MRSNSDVYYLLCVCNTFERQVIVEFLLTEPLLRDRIVFCKTAYASEPYTGRKPPLHSKVYSKQEFEHLERKYHFEHTSEIHRMFDQKEYWNKSQGTWTWVQIQLLPRCSILDKAFDLPSFDFTSVKWFSKDNELFEHKIGALEQLCNILGFPRLFIIPSFLSTQVSSHLFFTSYFTKKTTITRKHPQLFNTTSLICLHLCSCTAASFLL